MLFFLTVFGTYFLMNGSAWLLTAWQLRPPKRSVWIGLAAALAVTLTPLGIHFIPSSAPEMLTWAAYQATYLWLGILFYFLLFQILGSVLLLVSRLFRLAPAKSRLGRSVFLGSLVLTLLTVGYGFFEARFSRVAVYETITSSKVPRDVRIVQISDYHLGIQSSLRDFKELIAQIEELEPDLLLFTGDLVNDHVRSLEPFAEALRRLEPPNGKFAVFGNHEYYADEKQSESFYRRAGITLLRTEARVLAELNMQLLGTEDPARNRRAGKEFVVNQLEEVLQDLEPDRFSIALVHRPWGWMEKVVPAKVDLQLSGHTHKGQIFPFRYLVALEYPFLAGRYENGASVLLVSKGTGFWGPPIRVLAPPEFVIIDIQATKSAEE